MSGELFEQVARRIRAEGRFRVCLLIGASDTGKTSWAEALGERCRRDGPVLAVDSDVGQSHLGPPATIAWGKIEPGEGSGWEKIEPEGIFFTGSTSPAGNPLLHLAGLVRILAQARKETGRIFIDTTGLIHGPGLALKTAKIKALDPDLVIGLERERELDPILESFSRLRRPEIIRLPVSPEVGRKDPEKRAEFRRLAWARYFQEAGIVSRAAEKTWVWDIPDLSPEGTERISGRGPAPALIPINSLVGLQDENGRDLALGIIRGFDRETESLSIQTPARPETLEKVRGLALGTVRLDEGFREIS